MDRRRITSLFPVLTAVLLSQLFVLLVACSDDDDGSDNNPVDPNDNDDTSEVTPLSPPAMPEDFAAALLDMESVILSWTDPDTLEDGFVVQHTTVDTNDWREIAWPAENAEAYFFSGIQYGAEQFFRLRSYASDDDTTLFSPWTAAESVLPMFMSEAGSRDYRGGGVVAGNNVRTWTSNYGLVGNFEEISFQWPAGNVRNEYLADFSIMVGVEFPDTTGTLLPSVVTCHTPRGSDDFSPQGDHWGFEPVPGYALPNGEQYGVALSTDASTWPDTWPHKSDDWDGQWIGLHAPGEPVADLEAYYVINDASDHEFDDNKQDPFPQDTLRGGYGLRFEVRILQYEHEDYQDAIIFHYTICNEGLLELNTVRFGALPGTTIGGRSDTDDDLAAVVDDNLVISYDYDGVSYTPGWIPVNDEVEVGMVGVAVLESPDDHGMTSFDYFEIGSASAIRLRDDYDVWNRLTPGVIDTPPNEPMDADFLLGIGDFSLQPGESATVALGVIFGIDQDDVVVKYEALQSLAASGWER